MTNETIKAGSTATTSGYGRLSVSFLTIQLFRFSNARSSTIVSQIIFTSHTYIFVLIYLQMKGKKTTRLYVVDIQIANQTFCRNVYHSGNDLLHVYDTQICAYEPTARKGSCLVSNLHKVLQ